MAISGCSGGGSSDGAAAAVSQAFSGTAIDGLLSGTTVCIDVNENGQCDTGEPTATTNAQGQFEIPATTQTGPLLVIGGTDIGTGLPFTGSLTAPSGSKIISPLTSAIQSLVKSGKSPKQAEDNIKFALGIPADVNLTTFNPLESAKDVDTTVANNARAVMASQAHLQTIVHAASVAVASADSNKSTENVMGEVFAEISKSFSGATSDVNLTVANITAVTKSVANNLYVGNPVALVSVKNNAKNSAQSAFDAAEQTQATIEAGTPAEAETSLNSGITLVNTSIASDINASTASSVSSANDLNATALQSIVDAQQLQEEKEAAIAQAIQNALDAQQALHEAEIAAANASAEEAKAAYDALLEAEAEQLREAEAQRAAEAEAAEAQAQAAILEAQLAADQAAKDAAAAAAAAELLATQEKAKAEKAEAEARIAAAEEAAKLALLEANLEAAQLAAANAERNAAVNIMKTQAQAIVAKAYGNIPQVKASKDSIIFIQSLDSNYSSDTNITGYFTEADTALNDITILANDTNISAQSLYDFAALVANESNVTDANVTDANATLQTVIINGNLAKAQVTIAQTALDNTRARVLTIQADKADAQAAEAAEAEKQRVIGLIDTALALANDNNVSSDLSAISMKIALAEIDLNATIAIATEYSTLTIDTTTVQAAYQRVLTAQTEAQGFATDVNNSIAIIAAEQVKAQDANTTEVLSQAEAIKAQTAAEEVATRATEIQTIQTSIATALSTAEGLKQTEIDRLAAIETSAAEALALQIQTMATTVGEFAISANTTYDEASLQISDVQDTITQMYSIASQYNSSEALVLANEANATAQTLSNHFATLEGYVTTVNDANSSMVTAVSTQNLNDATTALNNAQTAIDAIEVLGTTVDPLFLSIETNHTAIIAIKTAADQAAGTALAFTDGMVISGFDERDGDLQIYTNTLSTGSLLKTKEILDVTSKVFVAAPSNDEDDLVLQANGTWVVDTSTQTYSLVDGNLELTNGTKVSIMQQIDLTSTSTEALAVISEVNNKVPGDANITFSTGAEAYILGFIQPESYKLWWIPADCTDYNQTTNTCNVTDTPYSTLEEFMGSNNSPAGIHNEFGKWEGVDFERNLDDNTSSWVLDKEVIDSTGAAISTLSAGQSGNMIKYDTASPSYSPMTVGSWSVITLPNTTQLAIEFTPLTGYESHFDGDSNLVAVANSVVNVGAHILGTTIFTVDQNNGANFNNIATADIKAAIEAYSASIPTASTFDYESYFVNKTIYSIETSEINGSSYGTSTTYTGTVSPTIGTYSGTDEYGTWDNNETYEVLTNGIKLFDLDGNSTAVYDGTANFNGTVFKLLLDNGTLLKSIVSYSTVEDRDAALAANLSGGTTTSHSLANEWVESTSGMTLRLTQDGYFDTNSTNDMEHGTYTSIVTFQGVDGDTDGIVTFSKNDDANIANGLFTDTNTSLECYYSLSMIDTLFLSCGDLDGNGSASIGYTFSVAIAADTNTTTDTNITTALAFTDGMVISGFDERDGDLQIYTNTLSTGSLLKTKEILDVTSKVFVAAPSNDEDDLVLQANGTWVVDTSTQTYSLVDGNLELTNGTKVSIMQQIDLTSTSTEALAVISEVNNKVPGDANITFSTGAEAYILGFIQPESYKLWWIPADCTDYNQTTNTCNVTDTPYSTLEEFMGSNNSPAGIHNEFGKWEGVDFERNLDDNTSSWVLDKEVIDSTGAAISTLSAGQSGNMIKYDTASPSYSPMTVGSWSVITLPNTTQLAIEFTPLTGYESHFDGDSNLVAVANSVVNVGAHILGTTIFTVDQNNGANFNNIATADIKAAIEAYSASIPTASTFDYESYFVNKTIYSIETSEINGSSYGTSTTYTGTVSPTIGTYSGTDEYGTWDNNETYEVLTNGIKLFDLDGNSTAVYDGTANFNGTVFKLLLDNGTLLKSIVSYSTVEDRDAALAANLSGGTTTSHSLANEWVESTSGMTLRLTQDGYFDTNSTNDMEHGTYTSIVTFQGVDGDTDGIVTFSKNDDANIANGLFTDTNTSLECYYSLSMIDTLFLSCGDLDGNGSASIGYTFSVAIAADTNTTTDTNITTVAYDDIYLSMIPGEALSGIIPQDDTNSSLTFIIESFTGAIGAGTDLNGTTGEFTVVIDANASVGTALINVNVNDETNTTVDQFTVSINVTYLHQSVPEAEYSKSDVVMDIDAFIATSTVAIPGDTSLHSFYGIDYDTNMTRTEIMEFNTTSGQLMFSGNTNNDVIYFTDTLATGEVNASEGGTTYDINSQVVSMKMIGTIEDNATLSSELNISMPSGSIAYQAALLFLTDEYDFYGVEYDYRADQSGIAHNSLESFVSDGSSISWSSQINRVLVFDKNATLTDGSGNLVELDISNYYTTGTAFVVNEMAGTWSVTTDINVNGGNSEMLVITPNDLERFDSRVYILDDFGVADGNTSSATNTVWVGEIRKAGRIEVTNYFNDTAATAIMDHLSQP